MGDILHILVCSMRPLFKLGTRVVLLCVSRMRAISDIDSTLELRNGNLSQFQTKVFTISCSRKSSNFHVTCRMLKIFMSHKDSFSFNRLITYWILSFVSIFKVMNCTLIKGFKEINQSSSYRFASISFTKRQKRFTSSFVRSLCSFKFCNRIVH